MIRRDIKNVAYFLNLVFYFGMDDNVGAREMLCISECVNYRVFFVVILMAITDIIVMMEFACYLIVMVMWYETMDQRQ
jgi:hypothetical protein